MVLPVWKDVAFLGSHWKSSSRLFKAPETSRGDLQRYWIKANAVHRLAVSEAPPYSRDLSGTCGSCVPARPGLPAPYWTATFQSAGFVSLGPQAEGALGCDGRVGGLSLCGRPTG